MAVATGTATEEAVKTPQVTRDEALDREAVAMHKAEQARAPSAASDDEFQRFLKETGLREEQKPAAAKPEAELVDPQQLRAERAQARNAAPGVIELKQGQDYVIEAQPARSEERSVKTKALPPAPEEVIKNAGQWVEVKNLKDEKGERGMSNVGARVDVTGKSDEEIGAIKDALRRIDPKLEVTERYHSEGQEKDFLVARGEEGRKAVRGAAKLGPQADDLEKNDVVFSSKDAKVSFAKSSVGIGEAKRVDGVEPDKVVDEVVKHKKGRSVKGWLENKAATNREAGQELQKTYSAQQQELTGRLDGVRKDQAKLGESLDQSRGLLNLYRGKKSIRNAIDMSHEYEASLLKAQADMNSQMARDVRKLARHAAYAEVAAGAVGAIAAGSEVAAEKLSSLGHSAMESAKSAVNKLKNHGVKSETAKTVPGQEIFGLSGADKLLDEQAARENAQQRSNSKLFGDLSQSDARQKDESFARVSGTPNQNLGNAMLGQGAQGEHDLRYNNESASKTNDVGKKEKLEFSARDAGQGMLGLRGDIKVQNVEEISGPSGGGRKPLEPGLSKA